jgi:hypothetical protein
MLERVCGFAAFWGGAGEMLLWQLWVCGGRLSVRWGL